MSWADSSVGSLAGLPLPVSTGPRLRFPSAQAGFLDDAKRKGRRVSGPEFVRLGCPASGIHRHRLLLGRPSQWSENFSKRLRLRRQKKKPPVPAAA